MTEQRHRCGGNLRPSMLTLRHRVGNFLFIKPVSGFTCSRCGEEVVERETALAIEAALTTLPQAVFEFHGEVTFGSIYTGHVMQSAHSQTSRAPALDASSAFVR